MTAEAWITGTPPNQKINFKLPTGAKGDKGDKGDDGANVLPTDTAVANAINTPGTATRTAVNAAIGASLRRVGPPSGGNDAPRIQSLLDAGGRVELDPDASYRIDTGLTIDVTKSALTGTLSKINAATMTTGAALTFYGTDSTPYWQTGEPWSGIIVAGPGKASAVDGMVFDTPGVGAGAASAHIIPRSGSVSGFRTGVVFYNGAYCITLDNFDIFNNAVGVDLKAGGDDAGERLTLTNSTIFNNDVGAKASNTAGALQFINCSLDYNERQIEVVGSKVFLYGCHAERTPTATVPFLLTGNGASLQMFGGWMLHGAGTKNTPYIVQNDSTGGGLAHFDGVHMNNLMTTTDRFATGAGRTIVEQTSAPAIGDNPKIVAASESVLIDGGFELSTIRDELYAISNSGGNNLTFALSTDQKRTGAQSLKITKAFGSGSDAELAILAPVERSSRAAMELYHMNPATGGLTGTVEIYRFYAVYRNGVLARKVDKGNTSKTLTGGYAWEKVTFDEPITKIPAWATHVGISFKLFNAVGPGSMYVDDVVATSM